ncbi:stage V sporulation protein AE [Bacillus pacificus]
MVTDGDEYTKRTIELLTKRIWGKVYFQHHKSNPTKLTGKKVVELIMQTPYDPVFVMFDDSGFIGEKGSW